MSWTEKLPLMGERKALYVDNNVIGNYYSERETTYAAVETAFEDPEIQIQCGRQVVDDAVNQLGRSAELRKSARETFTQLQQDGKLSVTGPATLTPQQRQVGQQLHRRLTRVLKAREADVVSEALAMQVPLLTLEARISKALQEVFADETFLALLKRLGLSQSLEITQPQPGALLLTWSL